MKKIFIKLIIISITLTFSYPLKAGMISITYTSEIITVSNSSGYNYGLSVGDILVHSYLADKLAPGYYTRNGSRVYVSDEYYDDGTLKKDAYYSELKFGVLLINPNYEAWSSSIKDDRYSINYYDNEGNYYHTMTFAGDDFGSHLFQYNVPNKNGLLVYNYNNNNQFAEDRFILRTIDFEITNVPIPGAVWLLGFGLIAFMGLKKKIRFFS